MTALVEVLPFSSQALTSSSLCTCGGVCSLARLLLTLESTEESSFRYAVGTHSCRVLYCTSLHVTQKHATSVLLAVAPGLLYEASPKDAIADCTVQYNEARRTSLVFSCSALNALVRSSLQTSRWATCRCSFLEPVLIDDALPGRL